MHCFLLSKQGSMVSAIGTCQAAGLASARMVGGVLIDAFTWRAWLGINVPRASYALLLRGMVSMTWCQTQILSCPAEKN